MTKQSEQRDWADDAFFKAEELVMSIIEAVMIDVGHPVEQKIYDYGVARVAAALREAAGWPRVKIVTLARRVAEQIELQQPATFDETVPIIRAVLDAYYRTEPTQPRVEVTTNVRSLMRAVGTKNEGDVTDPLTAAIQHAKWDSEQAEEIARLHVELIKASNLDAELFVTKAALKRLERRYTALREATARLYCAECQNRLGQALEYPTACSKCGPTRRALAAAAGEEEGEGDG